MLFNSLSIWVKFLTGCILKYFLICRRKQVLIFHVNCLQWKQIACNVKSCFLGEKRKIQSTLVISNSKGLSETLRDICTSTYQICGNEKNNKSNSTFNKWICNSTPEIRDILKILWKRGAISPLFHNILIPVVSGPIFHFEISDYSR